MKENNEGSDPQLPSPGDNEKIRELHVPYLQMETTAPESSLIAGQFDRQDVPFHRIDIVNWPGYPYKPHTTFRMGWNERELYLQFRVREKYLLARCTPGDDQCWPSNDSCVEFFVYPVQDDHYYNFEFSCIGYCLVEYGKGRDNRERFTQERIKGIRVVSSLGSIPFGLKEGDFSWDMVVAIPLEIMGVDGGGLAGNTWRGNFYKCGDQLPEQAFLTWNRVNTPEPDFHAPQYFGVVGFASMLD